MRRKFEDEHAIAVIITSEKKKLRPTISSNRDNTSKIEIEIFPDDKIQIEYAIDYYNSGENEYTEKITIEELLSTLGISDIKEKEKSLRLKMEEIHKNIISLNGILSTIEERKKAYETVKDLLR